MAEVTLNRPNWLGSEVGLVLKTVTVSSTSGTPVTDDNGHKILRAGTLINDPALGYGWLWNDADVTDGSAVKSMMIRGSYIDEKLPASVATNKTILAGQGLYAIKYSETVIAYGEVQDSWQTI